MTSNCNFGTLALMKALPRAQDDMLWITEQ
jgi:hypothetical protein